MRDRPLAIALLLNEPVHQPQLMLLALATAAFPMWACHQVGSGYLKKRGSPHIRETLNSNRSVTRWLSLKNRSVR